MKNVRIKRLENREEISYIMSKKSKRECEIVGDMQILQPRSYLDEGTKYSRKIDFLSSLKIFKKFLRSNFFVRLDFSRKFFVPSNVC